MRALLVVCLCVLSAQAAPKHKKKKAQSQQEDLLTAPQQPPQPQVNPIDPGQRVDSDAIKQAVQAYEDLDYQKCVDMLQKALGESLTRDEKIVTYRTLAFCHVALDKPDAAKFDFEHLLRIDDSYELDRRISPRIRAPFEEAKAAIATGESVEGQAGEVQYKTPTVVPTVSPARPLEGQPVSVAVALPDKGAAKTELFYKMRGRAVYNKVAQPGSPDGKFALTIPGIQLQAGAVEYYLNVLDDSNTTLAHAGTLSTPLTFSVTALKKPVYVRGWFWGVIAGVVVAGAVVGGVVAATLPSGPGKNTPATLTIMPQ